MYKFEFNLGPDGFLPPIFWALKSVEKQFDFIIETSDSVPRWSIAVDGKPVVFIAHAKGLGFSKYAWPALMDVDYKKVFKVHYSPNLFNYMVYRKYADRIVPCGLYRYWENTPFNKQDLLSRKRPIDAVALMRTKFRFATNKTSWIIDRKILISEANRLKELGFNTMAGKKIPMKQYEQLLLDTKIGFIWRVGQLIFGWKIPEFIQQGVVMITPSLGENYPFANGVIFEDNVHCVFCDDPNLYGQTAIKLLKDKERYTRIQKNVVELWEKKLCLEKMGEWYFKEIIEVL